MAELKEYKCPNCAGALKLDSALQKMKCPFCDSVEPFDCSGMTDFQTAYLAGYVADKYNVT